MEQDKGLVRDPAFAAGPQVRGTARGGRESALSQESGLPPTRAHTHVYTKAALARARERARTHARAHTRTIAQKRAHLAPPLGTDPLLPARAHGRAHAPAARLNPAPARAPSRTHSRWRARASPPGPSAGGRRAHSQTRTRTRAPPARLHAPGRGQGAGRRGGRGPRAGAAAVAAERAEEAEREPGAGRPALLLPAGDFPGWVLTPRSSLRPPLTMGDKGTR